MSSWPHFLQLTPQGLSGASSVLRKYQMTLPEPQLGQGSVRGLSAMLRRAAPLTVMVIKPSPWGLKLCRMTGFSMEQV